MNNESTSIHFKELLTATTMFLSEGEPGPLQQIYSELSAKGTEYLISLIFRLTILSINALQHIHPERDPYEMLRELYKGYDSMEQTLYKQQEEE